VKTAAFGCAVLLSACASQERVVLQEAETPNQSILTSEFYCDVGRVVAVQRILKHRDRPADNLLSIRVGGRSVEDVQPTMRKLVRLSGDELSQIPISLLRCPSKADGSGMSIIATCTGGEFRVLNVIDGHLQLVTGSASVEE
jgi:hypothetical protein